MAQNTPVKAQDAQALQSAFHTFNELSRELIGSYESLQQRVAQLNDELASAHEEKLYELTEKEKIANRLSAIMDALPAAVLVLDSKGRIQEANPPAIEMFCESQQETRLIGEKWTDIVESAFAPRSDDGHDISLRDGRRVNITTNPLTSESGQILLIKDVTQSRALTEQLNRFQKLTAMGDMAAGLAHQIRTPLSTSILYAGHLKQADIKTGKRIETVEKIQSQMRHIENLVNDMLMFARGEVTDSQPFSICNLLLDLEKIVRPVATKALIDLTISNKASDPEFMIIGSKEVLLSGLQNMINNAINSLKPDDGFLPAPENMKIDIQVEQATPEFIDIKIIDRGKGISEDQKERILEPFFTTSKQGTGLGLSVVDAIAQAHEGYLWFESEQGKGSTFALRLPVQKIKQGKTDQ